MVLLPTADCRPLPGTRHAMFLRAMKNNWISVVLGSGLAAYGLTRRTTSGFILAALGGALVWRGLNGVDRDDRDDRQVSVPYGRGVRVEKAVTIDASPERVYAFWRNFENLPRFMHNLHDVEVRDDTHSRWIVKGPAGSKFAWDAEIINEIPNELIGWRTIHENKVENAGSVHFKPAPGGRGTELKVVLRYDPPGGVKGAMLAKLLGDDPAMNVQEDLRRLKMLLETGEIATTKNQPTGRSAVA